MNPHACEALLVSGAALVALLAAGAAVIWLVAQFDEAYPPAGPLVAPWSGARAERPPLYPEEGGSFEVIAWRVVRGPGVLLAPTRDPRHPAGCRVWADPPGAHVASEGWLPTDDYTVADYDRERMISRGPCLT